MTDGKKAVIATSHLMGSPVSSWRWALKFPGTIAALRYWKRGVESVRWRGRCAPDTPGAPAAFQSSPSRSPFRVNFSCRKSSEAGDSVRAKALRCDSRLYTLAAKMVSCLVEIGSAEV